MYHIMIIIDKIIISLVTPLPRTFVACTLQNGVRRNAGRGVARWPRMMTLGTVTLVLGLTGCGSQKGKPDGSARPEAVKAQILRQIPTSARDRPGWATDIATALSSQAISPSTENICSVLAVIGQESNFNADPTVPDLANIARREIDRRARALLHIPACGARSVIVSLIRRSSLQRLFGNLNPVHTGGPMQVSIAFAQAHAEQHYPYPMSVAVSGGLHPPRRDLFWRRTSARLFGRLFPASLPLRRLQCRLVCQLQRRFSKRGEPHHRQNVGSRWRCDQLRCRQSRADRAGVAFGSTSAGIERCGSPPHASAG